MLSKEVPPSVHPGNPTRSAAVAAMLPASNCASNQRVRRARRRQAGELVSTGATPARGGQTAVMRVRVSVASVLQEIS
jgi:hypothetical protein